MTPVRLEPAALRYRVKHSTIEPLRSLPAVVGPSSGHIPVKKGPEGLYLRVKCLLDRIAGLYICGMVVEACLVCPACCDDVSHQRCKVSSAREIQKITMGWSDSHCRLSRA